MGGERILKAYQQVRQQTLDLVQGLSAEDCQVQSMPDASPVKWHLAHTSWFFETFALVPAGQRVFDEAYGFLFNSYYEAVGPRHARAERGLLTRPGLQEVLQYRQSVDAAVCERLGEGSLSKEQLSLITLGLHHEQQHQELLLTDFKHALSRNPLRPVFRARQAVAEAAAESEPFSPATFEAFPEGLYLVGDEATGFAYDNEGPRHRVFLASFELAERPVTNGEYLEFVRGGGYQNASLWLSDGWAWARANARELPLYWQWVGPEAPQEIREFSLSGMGPLDLNAPVCHLNYYEAAAFAEWAGARLPTEFEWEVAAQVRSERGVPQGAFLETGHLHPRARSQSSLGNVWEWTSSAYGAYPGFRPAEGAVGEYNGKFMCGQQVLRGGSCITPASHIRVSYRNFFPPHCNWQFSGLRLAR